MPLTMYDMSHHRIPRALGDPPLNPSPPAPSWPSHAYGNWNPYASRNSLGDASSIYSIDSHRASIASSSGGFDNIDDDSFLARRSSFQRIADAVHGELSVMDDEPEIGVPGVVDDATSLPSYAKVMRASTLNQMRHKQVSDVRAGDCRSANCSPVLAPDLATTISNGSGISNGAILPISNDIKHLSLAEGPAAPCNTPSCPSASRAEYVDADDVGQLGRFRARAMRKRSVTEPVPRDFVANRVKNMMLV